LDQAAGNDGGQSDLPYDTFAQWYRRITAAMILFQLLSGSAVILRPGSMEGYSAVFTVPVVFSLLPGSALVALLLQLINSLLIHGREAAPGLFPMAVWVPTVLAMGGFVLLSALSAVKGRPGWRAYWTLVIAELSCVLSPFIGLLFFGNGYALSLGLLAALVPLAALTLLVAARAIVERDDFTPGPSA